MFVHSSIDSLENFGNKVAFILAASTIVQVSIILLVLSTEIWYPGCAIIIIATGTLLSVCVLGTLLEVKRDEFFSVLYDVPWYLMPVKHQKEFLYILKATQTINKPITFWEYAEVSVSSFLDVFVFSFSFFFKTFLTVYDFRYTKKFTLDLCCFSTLANRKWMLPMLHFKLLDCSLHQSIYF